MHYFSRHITLVLGSSLALAHAQPDNLFLSDSLESTLNEQVDDIHFNSDGFIFSEPDFASNSLNQDETDLFFDANDPVVDPSLLNLATLPDSCGSEESSTDGPLQARDGSSCSSQEEQFDLPLELFEDPEKYLRDDLLHPPTGQAGQSGQGAEDGDLGFGAFMRNRDAPILEPLQNEQLCDREKFPLSTTPICSNPITGSVYRDVRLRDGFILIDAVPCTCLFRFLWAAKYTYLKRRYSCTWVPRAI